MRVPGIIGDSGECDTARFAVRRFKKEGEEDLTMWTASLCWRLGKDEGFPLDLPLWCNAWKRELRQGYEGTMGRRCGIQLNELVNLYITDRDGRSVLQRQRATFTEWLAESKPSVKGRPAEFKITASLQFLSDSSLAEDLHRVSGQLVTVDWKTYQPDMFLGAQPQPPLELPEGEG